MVTAAWRFCGAAKDRGRQRVSDRMTWTFAGALCAAILASCASGTSTTPKRADAARVSPVPCDQLPFLRLGHLAVTEARLFEPATVPHYASREVDEGTMRLPATCRIHGVSRPTADSEIRFEVVVPVGDAWNGRYEQVGNGAFAGRIPEEDILESVALGFAAAATDDGHEAGPADASWALGHPEKVVDFGYRAVKETHDAARAILLALTGRAPKYSYFSGCSDGGREALMEAQRFPDDFDGIVAGAPAIPTTRVLLGFAWDVLALEETPGSYIPRTKLETIEAAALAACGDEDGVIGDPRSCHFDPSSLECSGVDSPRCLTRAQVAALRKIYGGARTRTGEAIEPGYEPGGEAEPHGPQPDGWSFWISGGAPGPAGATGQYRLARSFFESMVFEVPGYDLHRLDFDRDVVTTDAKLASILNPDDPDLFPFARRGGKLIHYHGWVDAVIPPRDSVAYHDRVTARIGDAGRFYRLFMAPGMTHCYGGRGPNVLATRDAIVAWVERGVPPDRLLATKYVEDNPSKAIVRTRPLCPYPQRAEWNGHGDRRSADSFDCAAERLPR
jgi:feruloyl esterase